MSSIYDIVISGASFTGNTTPREGFLDLKSVYTYMANTSTLPTSLATATAKAKANRRYRNLILMIQTMGNAYVRANSVTGGGIDSAPTSITVRIEFEHGDNTLYTADESNAGQWLTGIAAIKRCAARALTLNEAVHLETFDPTTVAQNKNGAVVNTPKGITSFIATVGNVAADLTAAEAAITVTKI